MECGVPAPLEDLDDTEVVFVAKIADADALDPGMFAETKCALKWPPCKATTEESATCRARPAAQEPNHTGSINYDDTHSTAPHFTAKHGLAHRDPSKCIPLTLFDTLDSHSTDQAPTSTAECLTTHDVPYREAVDTLSWAALAMPPDPTLSLAMVICFAVEPKPAYWEPIKQTPHHPSVTHAKTNSPPEGFANANGSMAKDWHAISGRASFIDGSTIPLPSRQHKDIPLPSTDKGKHVVTTHGSNEASWLCSLVLTFFNALKSTTTLFSDTPAAIAPMHDCQYPPRTEHIDVQCHQSHQVVEQGSCLVYPPTDNIMADVHTAPLSAKENHFAAPLGLRAK